MLIHAMEIKYNYINVNGSENLMTTATGHQHIGRLGGTDVMELFCVAQ